MSAADPLLALEATLPALPAAIDGRRLGEGLTRAVSSLRTSERQIDRIEALLALSDLIGFGEVEARAEMVTEVRDAAHLAGGALATAGTAVELDKAVSAYEHDLASALNSLDRGLGQHWRTVSGRLFEPLIAIGNLLDRIDPESDLGRRLAECGAVARTIPEGIGGLALLDRARDLLAERARLQTRRRDELGEGDVATFVNALAEDRATLAMITPEVWTWLEENHALGRLRVRPV